MTYGKKGGYGNSVVNRSHAKASNFPGYKCLPTNKSPSRSSSGKMSSTHGTGPVGAAKSLHHASNRIGADKKGFKSGPVSPRPKKID